MMNVATLESGSLPCGSPIATVLSFATRIRRGSPLLAAWGAALALGVVVMLGLLFVDDRLLRGTWVWAKPIKFCLSLALLAWTSAFFMTLLPAARRGSMTVRGVAAVIVGAGSFELLYIVWQAAHGQPSHFFVSDPFHAAMYALMGVGAMSLTASQGVLAWQVHRHAGVGIGPAFKLAVVLGLTLTTLLGSAAGAVLASHQPQLGSALPLVGWNLRGGDLRPAHFLGIHAEQLLPAFGWIVGRRAGRNGRVAVWLAAVAYVVVFAIVFRLGQA